MGRFNWMLRVIRKASVVGAAAVVAACMMPADLLALTKNETLSATNADGTFTKIASDADGWTLRTNLGACYVDIEAYWWGAIILKLNYQNNWSSAAGGTYFYKGIK